MTHCHEDDTKRQDLKLYVWKDVLCAYTEGVMFALAHDVDEARALLLADTYILPRNELARTPEEHSAPYAFAVWGGG